MLKVDCEAWEALTLQRKHCEDIGAWANVDFTDKALEALAAAVLADPRRENDVASNCANYLQDMKAKISSPNPPKMIVDPSHSSSALDAWLDSLTDDELKGLKAGVTNAEKRRRKK
ncbi:hypothetical protein J2X45_001737 [Caulobacter sp. BE264]|uniref:hypothetical protein n=1 Tax=Caulobacter sp. BE264 TaxID=2817724 RepID=UPI0028658260|nr:hypothetical protein [Caulobacter sp. BE264]MDR7230646.1 hypothetical protein [Caulobacter sp. BE264]